MKLAEYRYTVEHKPGANHSDADGISRLVSDIVSIASHDLFDAVLEDPQIVGAILRRPVTVTTARSLQAQATARAERQATTSASDVITHYLDAGVPTGDALRRAQAQAEDTDDRRFGFEHFLVPRVLGPPFGPETPRSDRAHPSLALRLYSRRRSLVPTDAARPIPKMPRNVVYIMSLLLFARLDLTAFHVS